MKMRLRYTGLHLLGSLAIAGIATLLAFGLWYPPPFDQLSEGRSLFLLLVGIDVAVGPMLTAVIASPAKPRTELLRDLGVILVLQLGALAYGLHTMAQARPVVLVHEIDLFRVLTAADLDANALAQAPPELRSLSWCGPKPVAVVRPPNADEQFRTIELALAGVPLSMLPRYWRPYDSLADTVWTRAKPLHQLIAQHPAAEAAIQTAAATAGEPVAALRYAPVLARHTEGVLLLARPARVVGYLPLVGEL